MQGGEARIAFRYGDPLLSLAAGLLAALGKADEFPQNRAGIEALIAAIAKGPEGEEVRASYEAPDELPTYVGGWGTWVAPAGGGRLRLRLPARSADRPTSHAWVLGPDGSLGDPETIDGFGIPDAELPERARAELEKFERQRRKALAALPEIRRRAEERRDRFRLDHLLGVVVGPPDQDPSGPVLSHVVLHDTGLIVDYLLPRPDEKSLDPDDPLALHKAARHTIELEDGLGTAFQTSAGQTDANGEGPLRCRREFTPAVPAAARRLLVKLDETGIEIDPRPQ